MALGTAAINQAIREGRAAQMLRVLRNPDVGLRGVQDACAAGYQEQLQALAATKRPTGTAWGWDPLLPTPLSREDAQPWVPHLVAGSTKPLWVRHRLQDGSEFYLSLQSFEGSWERPGDAELCATHLSREEIQVWDKRGSRAGAVLRRAVGAPALRMWKGKGGNGQPELGGRTGSGYTPVMFRPRSGFELLWFSLILWRSVQWQKGPLPLICAPSELLPTSCNGDPLMGVVLI